MLLWATEHGANLIAFLPLVHALRFILALSTPAGQQRISIGSHHNFDMMNLKAN